MGGPSGPASASWGSAVISSSNVADAGQGLRHDIAASCCPGQISSSSIASHGDTGEWEANLRVSDRILRTRQFLLHYQETVEENGHVIDVYRRTWTPKTPYENVGDSADLFVTIDGRPDARFLCGRDVAQKL